jgi:hypothetical protein
LDLPKPLNMTVIVVLVFVGFVIWAFRASRRRRVYAVVPGRDDKAAAERAIRVPFPPITVVGFMTEPGEAARYTCQAKVIGSHAEIEHVGGFSGASIRVARGLYVRSGGGRSHAVKHEVTGVDDSGTLVITDRRLVFLGNAKTLVIPLTKIINVIQFTDGLRVDIENKKPELFETGSRVTGVVVDRARRGLLAIDLNEPTPAQPAREAL